MKLPNSGVVQIAGAADKPANRVVIAEGGSVTLARAWSPEELAAFDRIEVLLMGQGEVLDRMANMNTTTQTMTPEAQRIAIAEACGWKRKPEFDYKTEMQPDGVEM